jgi:hypothetical protein
MSVIHEIEANEGGSWTQNYNSKTVKNIRNLTRVKRSAQQDLTYYPAILK